MTRDVLRRVARRSRRSQGTSSPIHLMTPFLKPLFPNGGITFRVESAMKNEGLFAQ